MRATKYWIATGSMLAVLLALLLALAWWHPAPIAAETSALPPPPLSDDDVADAPYNWNWFPGMVLDGIISPGEYAGAGKVTFAGSGGDVEVFFKQDAANLWVAFDLPVRGAVPANDAADLFLDTDLSTDPLDPNDHWLSVRGDGILVEHDGTGGAWNFVPGPYPDWAGAAGPSATGPGWQAEFMVQYAKLGLVAGTFQELGLALGTEDGGRYYWPAGADPVQPVTWGSLVSSSDWGTTYWKPGPWEDYAPSGMPDFDQKQATLPSPNFCGPLAMANSMWWFDSKFETPDHSPTAVISDTYRLVTSYDPAAWDDHDPLNVVPLALDLASYFNTDSAAGLGTLITDMYTGTLNYLRDHGLWDDYTVTLVEQPSFEWVADEVQRSEDVILLLGFYWDMSGGSGAGPWTRIGGHYVTVAGVDFDPGAPPLVALSDPYADMAEALGFGRVLNGFLIPHSYPPPPPPLHDPREHNDAGNISHDQWGIRPTRSPGGTWGLFNPQTGDYYFTLSDFGFDPLVFLGANLHPDPTIPTIPLPAPPQQVWTEVEFALAVSPFDWKASGEWLPEEDPVSGTWLPWQDYAPSGVPDIDQKQDGWIGPPFGNWTFCGPVAAANSLWWFDAKFEPAPVPPPAGNDNYPLVERYGNWDDHDMLNVDNPLAPWPPPAGGGWEFVEDLALYFDTDGFTTGIIHGGTNIQDMAKGLDAYLVDHGLRQGYVIKVEQSPGFWWVAEQVEVSEDVILLLGFWQWQEEPTGEGKWVRLGGHYVTLPGVDKQGGFVAFSDPWFNRIELTWPYAGLGSVPGWPSYMGRVADGWLTPVHPLPHGPIEHNDAGNISHDIYNVVGTDSPGGMWGPEEYADFWSPDVENFWGQNNQNDLPNIYDAPIQTEVDWALAVSPVADVWIDKDVYPNTVLPGDWVTYTLQFGNEGSLVAENVVITEILPVELINPSWAYWTSNGLPISERPGYTYVWDVPDLDWGDRGSITVTAQVDPSLVLVTEQVVGNKAEISTTTEEQPPPLGLPNVDLARFVIVPPPTWHKQVDGVDWYPGIAATVGTSDTIEIVDVISATRPFTLTETWDPAHLQLGSYVLDPNTAGTVVASSGALTLTVAPGTWVTLTKEFVVQPCDWQMSELTEELEMLGRTWDKPVNIIKEPPVLSIASDYDPWVLPGSTGTFTLTYLNSGGAENDVWILNQFPISAPFDSALPAPTVVAPDGTSARWNIGYLGQGDGGSVVVNVAISDVVKYPDIIDIWDGIYDHLDLLMDEVTTTFEVTKVIVAHIYLPLVMRDYTAP